MSFEFLNPINCFKYPIQCWRCTDIVCSCGASAGRAANVPALVIILGVFLHCIFLFVKCFLRILSELFRIITEIFWALIPFSGPLFVFLIVLVGLYFWQIFAPTVLDFIMNALIPFINVVIDIYCFIMWLLLTLYRIVALIWNIFVPLIGLILYIIIVIIVEIFLAIVLLLLDIIFEILAALLEILIALVSIVIQILIACIQVGLEALMLVVDAIMPIVTLLISIITILLNILTFIIGLFFLQGGSSLSRSKRDYIPNQEDALIQDVFGDSYNSDSGYYSPHSNEYSAPSQKQNLEWLNDNARKESRSKPSLFNRVSSTLSKLDKDNPYVHAALHSNDPYTSISRVSDEGKIHGLSHHAVVHTMEALGFGPEEDFPAGDPARYDWSTNVVRNIERVISSQFGFSGANRIHKRHNGAEHEENHIKKRRIERYTEHSKARNERVYDRLGQAWNLVNENISKKYSDFRDTHAHDDVIDDHIERMGVYSKNRTGFNSFEHAMKWMYDYVSENDPTRYGYDHFLHTISPSHHPIHQALQQLDPHKDKRRFWNVYVDHYNLTDFNTTTHVFPGHNIADGNRRRVKRMEFAILATTDCFGSEPRNPLCLPEIPANFSKSVCPPKLCFPYDINEATCEQFGYRATNCVFCFERILNGIRVLLFIFSLFLKVLIKLFFNLAAAFPFLSFLKNIPFFDIDGVATTVNVLCSIIYLYDLVLVIFLLYVIQRWVWPLFMILLECITSCINAHSERKAYLDELASRDVERGAIDREIAAYSNARYYQRGRSTYITDTGPGNIVNPPKPKYDQIKEETEKRYERRYGVSFEDYIIDRYSGDPRIGVSIDELIEAHSYRIKEQKRQQRENNDYRTATIGTGTNAAIGSVINDEEETRRMDEKDGSNGAMHLLNSMCQNDLEAFEVFTQARYVVYTKKLRKLFGLSDPNNNNNRYNSFGGTNYINSRIDGNENSNSSNNSNNNLLTKDEKEELEDLRNSLVKIKLGNLHAWREGIKKTIYHF